MFSLTVAECGFCCKLLLTIIMQHLRLDLEHQLQLYTSFLMNSWISCLTRMCFGCLVGLVVLILPSPETQHKLDVSILHNLWLIENASKWSSAPLGKPVLLLFLLFRVYCCRFRLFNDSWQCLASYKLLVLKIGPIFIWIFSLETIKCWQWQDFIQY